MVGYDPVRDQIIMARTKSPRSKISRPVGREVSGALVAHPEKVSAKQTASKAQAPANAPIFTATIQLSELGKAVSHRDLFPLSTFDSRLAHGAFASHQPPLATTSELLTLKLAPIMVASVETLGALVRAYREKSVLSQQSFAERAGVGRRFISELENGKPSLEFDKVLAVARAADIDLFAAPRASPAP
jgi:y4mF family transcriptional regulator